MAEMGTHTDTESTTGPPLWVKVFGIIALAVVLLFIVVMLIGGGGGHGPGRHTGGGGGDTPHPTVTEHRPPAGSHAP